MRKYSVIFILLFFSCTNKYEKINKTKLFNLVENKESGLDFKNILRENINTKENLFDFDYFYNGAGVAIGDINNDGLQDVFFCGNQVKNKLYLNKGNLKFDDISIKANINENKFWSNGVTFVDINNDGWLDIYISQGGPNRRSERKNLLYINQKDETFIEQSKEFGLDDDGISTQTVFFDFDKDGDLDCLVSNESELYGLDPISFNKKFNSKKEYFYYSTPHFYINENGIFKNSTKEVGINLPSFGLGIVASDINNDGWIDFYISNDYYLPDALYINNKNGTFSNKINSMTNQIPFYGMGVDIADINNDGLQDIFSLDMASSDHIRAKTLMASMNIKKFELLNKLNYKNQYMFNALQLNTGNNKFHNISSITNTSKTDWSWAALIADYDNDENKDIYVTNGYRKYALDNDFRSMVTRTKIKYNGTIPDEIKKELYNKMPSEKLSNIIFKNNGNLSFNNNTIDWNLDIPSFSNGACYSDLDNDGDLDLIINNIDQQTFLFKNNTSETNSGNFLKVKTIGNTSENFAKITIKYNNKLQFNESKRVKGYLSSSDNLVHFGLGKVKQIDTVSVEWLNGKSQEKYNVKVNSFITFNIKNAFKENKETETQTFFQKIDPKILNLNYKHQENNYDDFSKEILLPYKQSTLGPNIILNDVNNDNKTDIFIGSSFGQESCLFIQKNGKFYKKNIPVFKKHKNFEDISALFFDYDNDNDNDLFIISGGNAKDIKSENYRNRLYNNDGNGNFTEDKKNINVFQNAYSSNSACSIDYDNDGDLDLIVGNRLFPQNYPKAPPSIVYNNTNGFFKEVTNQVFPELQNFGMINKIIATDFNNDNWTDLIVVGEWTKIGIYKNVNGKFIDISEKSNLNNEKGWWFNIAETDINNDGLKDYIVGNIGNNIKFKVDEQNPLKIYANDFDSNGSLDIVLANNYKNKIVPIRGKECSTQQMPFISRKYKTYSEYAKASIDDIYGDFITNSYQLEANNFSSIILINKGDGIFEKQNLPFMAQIFPIKNLVFHDFNNDGYQDVLLIGNIYNTEVETPRLDNGSGLLFISNKKDNYYYKEDLNINGNSKSLKIINIKNNKYLIIGKNNDSISSFKLN